MKYSPPSEDSHSAPGAEYILCEFAPECENKVKNHAWGRIKATDWFFSKSEDKAYCPEHIPEWVKRWREKAAMKRHEER
jgi:hypothetical protein